MDIVASALGLFVFHVPGPLAVVLRATLIAFNALGALFVKVQFGELGTGRDGLL